MWAGGTDGAFCALSAALSEPGAKGCYYLIDEAPPIRQAACLLNRTMRKGDTSRLTAACSIESSEDGIL